MPWPGRAVGKAPDGELEMENEGWQSAVKQLAESQKELSDRVVALSVVVRELSGLSLQRPVPPGQSPPESGSSEPVKMTFEEFANEAGLKF